MRDNRPYRWQPFDAPDHDVWHTYTRTPTENAYHARTAECTAICDKSPDCKGFVQSNWGDCWFKKKALVTRETNRRPAVAPQQMPSRAMVSKPYRSQPFDAPGHDLWHNKVETPTYARYVARTYDCSDQCDKRDDCKGFVQSNSGDCWFKSAMFTTENEPRPNMIPQKRPSRAMFTKP